jgi:hypothetical protein
MQYPFGNLSDFEQYVTECLNDFKLESSKNHNTFSLERKLIQAFCEYIQESLVFAKAHDIVVIDSYFCSIHNDLDLIITISKINIVNSKKLTKFINNLMFGLEHFYS